MPKSKVTVVLTRPQEDSISFAEEIRDLGFNGTIVISPLLKIVQIAETIDYSGYDGVVFTSRNAVSPAPNAKLIAWCVGTKTQARAEQLGWQTRSADGNVDDLFHLIRESHATGPLLHLRGAHTTGNLAARLSDAGIKTTSQIVYDQAQCALSSEAMDVLNRAEPVLIPVFSPRTAQILQQEGPFKAPIHCLAISDAVMRELQQLSPQKLLVSKQQSAKGMLDAMKIALMQLDAL